MRKIVIEIEQLQFNYNIIAIIYSFGIGKFHNLSFMITVRIY